MKKSRALRTPFSTVVLSVLTAAVLSACGGGGDDAPPPPVVTPVAATAIPETLAIDAAAISDVASATAFSNSAATLSGLTFAWSFGDGTSSTDASPKHDYAKVGDYDVTLKVSNTAGVSKDVKFKISVNNRAHVRGLACTAANDSGWCWQQPKPTGTTREDYFFLDAQTAWSVGENGEIFKTVDGGKNWAKQNSGVQTRLFTIRFADANNGWALGAFGAVLRTTNGGGTWALQSVGITDGYDLKLRVLDAQTAIVTSGNGRVRATSDGGATWSDNLFPTTEVAADGALWSLSYNGLSRSIDGGKSSTTMLAFVNGSSYNTRLYLPAKNVIVTLETSSNYDPSTYQYLYKLRFNRSVDNGASWISYEAQGLPSNVYGNESVSFGDANTASLVYNDATYRSTDGGRNWARVSMPANPSGYYTNNRLLEGGAYFRYSYYGGENMLSEDGGVTWTRVTAPTTNGLGNTVKRLGAKTWVSVTGDSASVSTDGMLTWTVAGGTDPRLTQRSMLATWFFDAKHGLGFNAMGDLQETVNGGIDWTVKVKDIVSGPVYGGARFQFVSATKGWLLAPDGRVYRSVDGGALWSAPLASRNTISSFHFIDENKGFAQSTDATGKPQLLVSTDGGQSWAAKAELPQAVNDLRFSSNTQGIGVGYNGRIISTNDGGATWTTRFSGTGSSLLRLTSSDAGTVWAVGDSGALLKSVDAGASWTRVLVGNTSSLNSIRFLDAQRGWITGANGTLLATQDGGKTWTPQYTGTQKSLSDVFFVDARTGWLLGVEGTILSTGTGGL